MLRHALSRSLGLASLCALGACHQGSSGSSVQAPQLVSSLGLAFTDLIGEGDHWLVVVPEAAQGRDLDRDGDLDDAVLELLDLATGRLTNTGLVLGMSVARDFVPTPLVGVGSVFALGASEFEMGARDLNGDGDAFDQVLLLVDPRSGAVTNLGLAVSRLQLAGDFVSFDVPEVAQGADLDGDNVVDPSTTVPFFHDLRTGETWNSGLRGARTLNGDGSRVALVEFEGVVGDRNGDGDALDAVLAFYDLAARTLTSSGLALTTFKAHVSPPIAHGGRWGVLVDEAAQGLGDLNGDGVPFGSATFVYDPSTGHARNFPGLELLPVPDVAPFVLAEFQGASEMPWLYDPDSEQLTRSGWSSVGIQSVGDQLVFSVVEAQQGADLDGDGALGSVVPVVYDPRSGSARSVGVDGYPISAGRRLLVLSEEQHAGRDWNGDGDLEDSVLHTWDLDTSRLENTGISTRSVAPFAEHFVLFLRSEAEVDADLNGDGDREDEVAHLYDTTTGSVTDLRLASTFLLGVGGAGQRGFLPVSELTQGADLNGDGDRADIVLFLVQPQLVGG